jgi:hypothetical protein
MMTTASRIETPSSQPSSIPWVIIPRTNEAMAATHRIRRVGSSKFYRIISNRVFGGFTMAALF